MNTCADLPPRPGLLFDGDSLKRLARSVDKAALRAWTDTHRTLLAPDALDAAAGRAVLAAIEDDVMPREWLVNGPFLRGTQDEALQQVGGFAGVRPEPGTQVTVEGTALDFRRYLPAGYASPRGPMTRRARRMPRARPSPLGAPRIADN